MYVCIYIYVDLPRKKTIPSQNLTKLAPRACLRIHLSSSLSKGTKEGLHLKTRCKLGHFSYLLGNPKYPPVIFRILGFKNAPYLVGKY